MGEKIRDYVNNLFKNAPVNSKTVDMKEELISNLTEKCEELIRGGKSAEEAFAIAVAEVGDVSDLLRELGAKYPDACTVEYVGRGARRGGRMTGSVLVSFGAMLLLLAAIPLVLIKGSLGAVIAIACAAVALGLMIFGGMAYDKPNGRRFCGGRNVVMGLLIALVWTSLVPVYFIVSFATGLWAYTWIAFLIAPAITILIVLLFRVFRRK